MSIPEETFVRLLEDFVMIRSGSLNQPIVPSGAMHRHHSASHTFGCGSKTPVARRPCVTQHPARRGAFPFETGAPRLVAEGGLFHADFVPFVVSGFPTAVGRKFLRNSTLIAYCFALEWCSSKKKKRSNPPPPLRILTRVWGAGLCQSGIFFFPGGSQ